MIGTIKRVWPATLLGLALLAARAMPLLAAMPVPTEYQVKAAFLFNFAKFVEWPPGTFPGEASPVVIGLVGEDPFGEALDQSIQNKLVQGHPLILRRLRVNEDLKQCHVLFVSRSEKQRLGEILAAVKGSAVLTVSEVDQFLEQGGMINFFIESESVKFGINVQAAQSSGLKLSAKLLAVARNVTRGPNP